ncbi:hypothetical protein F5B21DRAFT_187763 [Xylaria acuta]|nr:hypothetical protein F5B21DRAFT_187763 [Xylaria acuta]
MLPSRESQEMPQNIHHLNGNNGPQGGQFQGYPQGHSGVPPAPPRVSIPVDLRGGPTIEITDVRDDLLSESDMKEELSEYVIIRFEKVTDKDEIDEHGRPKWPSWEQAIRTQDWSISKKDAIRKIRQLNSTTKSVLDKKNSLTPPLKRQIDRTQEDLMRWEPDVANYHWTLVQIDHQLRAIEPYFSSGPNYQPAREHRSTTHRISPKRSHTKGRSRHSKKRAYERLSLTAYFKRVPRSGVDIRRLWEDNRTNLHGGIRAHPGEMHNAFPPMQHNNTFLTHQQQQQHQHQQQQHQHQQQQKQPQQQQKQPQQQHQQQQQQQQQPQQQRQQQQHASREQGPPPTHHPNQNPQNPHPQGQHPQGHHPPGRQPTHPSRPVNHGAHQHGGQGHQQNLNRGANGPRRSESSSDSECDSRSSRRSSSSRTRTPPSSVSDHRGRGHHHKDDDHHHHQPHHVHHGAGNHPHAHPLGHGLPRMNSIPRLPRTSLSPHRSPPPPRMPVPPYPVSHDGGSGSGSVASHIERIREDAYRRGRLDARLAEELAFSSSSQAPRGRPRPHIVQVHSPPPLPPPRHILYRDRRRSSDGDDEEEVRRALARLSVYDRDDDDDDEEDDVVVDYRREDAQRRRRQQQRRRLGEFEYRAQRGSVLEDDPFAASPPSSYAYSTDGRGPGPGHRRVEIHPEPRPLTSRVRRVVSYY